jgi:hypothetical protein
MRYITAFLIFWYDLIAGDDWTLAASIYVAIVSILRVFRMVQSRQAISLPHVLGSG